MKIIPLKGKPEQAANAIANEVNSWLKRECLSAHPSVGDNYFYLDKIEVGHRSLRLPFDDPSNFNTVKHNSHHNRQRFWGEALILKPTDDYATARHIFNPLMQISGNARMMRYLRAKDQDDYDKLKVSDEAIGTSALHVIENRIIANTQTPKGDTRIHAPTTEEVQASTMAAFDQKRKVIELVIESADQDIGKPQSESLTRLALSQAVWLEVVTDSVLMAAGYRDGELAAVPFLEPKSISESPQVYYPFAA